MIAKENIYVNSDRSKVVPSNDPDVAFLLVAKGQVIADAHVKKYGLGGEVKAEKPEPKPPGPSGVQISGRETRVPSVPNKR